MPSPYAWISEAMWAAWNPSGAVDPGFRNPIREPLVTPVTEDDRARAGKTAAGTHAPPPPLGAIEDGYALLASTRGCGHVSQVRWPVCCARLTTLMWSGGAGPRLQEIEAEAGDLGGSLLASHVEDGGGNLAELLAQWQRALTSVRAGRHAGDGINLFGCSGCGRVYGSCSEP